MHVRPGLTCVASILSGAILMGVGCSSSPPDPQCVPGESVACVGVGGCSGGQVCNADGKSFGACDCGGLPDAGAVGETDAGTDDAGVADAGFSMPLDHLFVVSDWKLPTTISEARSVGVDLDGKIGVDNSLGTTLANLTSLAVALGDGLTAQTNDGSFILLLNVQTEDPPDARAIVFAYSGANPEPAACADSMDIVCRRHLDGSATFTASATPDGSPGLSGSLTMGAVDARAMTWELPFRLADADLVLPVSKPRTLLTMKDGSITQGRFAGALPMTWVEGSLLPAIADFTRGLVVRDCTSQTPPDCGCLSGSSGRDILGQLDKAPADCTVSNEELASVPGAWVPDIDLDGDGTNDAMSFGFGFSGVSAQYTVP